MPFYKISMKLSGTVLDMKRIKTDEFGNMFAHSCPGLPIIQAQIKSYLVPDEAGCFGSSDFKEMLRL